MKYLKNTEVFLNSAGGMLPILIAPDVVFLPPSNQSDDIIVITRIHP